MSSVSQSEGETEVIDQPTYIYRKLKMDEDFPNWVKEMFQRHGAYNSPEKLPQNFDLEEIEDKSQDYFFLGFNLNEQKHGYGVLMQDNKFYEGGFESDNKKGWGRQLEPNLLMEGKWENNQIVSDKIIIKGNFKFFGQFSGNTLHGRGTMIDLEKEEQYEGNFELGIMNGKGTIKNLKYDAVYNGDIRNNQMEGKGIFRFTDGMEYEGEFLQNQLNGKGYLVYPNGMYYKGDFFQNKMHGMGILKEVNQIYEGEFRNGLKHGYGKMSVNNIEIVGIWDEDKLSEEFE
ncbi:unnamed protein product (macronuclear) [Paramecium tetraurelia]|uniref:MORN repeat protein n=1 Tax=Paramecium tetraurelia TaxID=5888 RepID=A0E812_PARTE|nr:uncharacterized protein GSPATT00024157001 [Paramecium tetraurelia]CAK91429.1 unnamed protein product [Paramecium tetraurelia]|eukprot:XP_001458826.1 hypothetical protein (macronuclear) [Paramecium tetraurelia strain d4-2]